MTAHVSKDPLHGVTLEMQVTALVARYGWNELGNRIKINCFRKYHRVKSSLKFLSKYIHDTTCKTDWCAGGLCTFTC